MIYEVKNMIKEHIHDLFTEGFGDIFFMKYYRFLKKNVQNKTIKEILIAIHRVFYIIFLLIVAYVIFILSWPL